MVILFDFRMPAYVRIVLLCNQCEDRLEAPTL